MGYNYGARNGQRLMSAYRVALAAAITIMVVGVILFQTMPEPMILMFSDTKDPEATAALLQIGLPALHIISWSFLGAAFGIINMTMFQSTGRGAATLIVSVCRQLVVLVPTAWLLGHLYGLQAIWFAFPIAEIIAFCISAILLHRAYQTDYRFLRTPQEG